MIEPPVFNWRFFTLSTVLLFVVMQTINKNPLVSILMPARNAEDYISAAIESVIAQTYQNWELIILNDCSSDKTVAIVKKFQKKDNRLKLVNNNRKLGIGASVNKILKIAHGDFIARMDADDLMFPERLEKQVEFLRLNPQIGLVGSYMVEIDERGTIYGLRKVPTTHKYIKEKLYTSQTIQNPSLMMNLDSISKKELYFDNALSPVDDLDFLFRQIQDNVLTANIPEILMAYRKHNNNSSLKNIKKTFALTQQVRRKATNSYNYCPNKRQRIISFVQLLVIRYFPEFFLKEFLKKWRLKSVDGTLINEVKLRNKINKRTLSLVIPVYNEGEVLRTSVERIRRVLEFNKLSYELIVVVDGGSDETKKVARNLAKEYPGLKIYSYLKNRGKGYAVKLGFSKAKGDYIGFVDAGLDISLYSLQQMIDVLLSDSSSEVFFGNKQHYLSQTEGVSFVRKVMSLMCRYTTNILLGVDFIDTQVGLKIFKKSTIKIMLEKLPCDISGFAFDVELMQLAKEMGRSFVSCPVVIVKNEKQKTTVSIKSVIIMIRDLIKLAISSRIKPNIIGRNFTASHSRSLID